MSDNVIPIRPPVVAHYRKIRSFAEAEIPDDEFDVILASEDEKPGVVHVMLLGKGAMEVIDTFRDTDAGRNMAKIVGEAANKVLCYAEIYDGA